MLAPAIDALEKEPLVDPKRVYLFGYSLGGMVGHLHSGAGFSGKRCGFDLRLHSNAHRYADRRTGGMARYS